MDHYHLPEILGHTIADIETRVLSGPTSKDLESMYTLKRENVLTDRAMSPVLEVVNQTRQDDAGLVSESLTPYLQVLSDHARHLLCALRALRDMASNLPDLYLSVMSNNMNQVTISSF